jgi:hypothetical protein
MIVLLKNHKHLPATFTLEYVHTEVEYGKSCTVVGMYGYHMYIYSLYLD